MTAVNYPMEKPDFTETPVAARPQNECSSDPESLLAKLEGQEDPMNWSTFWKGLYTCIVVGIAGIVSFSSSVHTPAIRAISKDLHTSTLVSTLGGTTYLVGFGFGPFFFAPLAEVFGRNPIYRSTFLVFCLANLGCALSPNIAALLVFRFIAGFFGSPSVANSGGSIIDLWPESRRSVPLAFFTVASYCGPVLAPIVGGFLTQYVSWRWNFWLVLIASTSIYVLAVVFLPETYPTKLLDLKSKKDHQHRLGVEARSHEPLKQRFSVSLTRPWIMLFTEPILISLSLYMAFIYGVLFLDFTAYPIVFQRARGWDLGISGLSFLGIGLGMAIAAMLSPLVDRIHVHYVQKLGGPASPHPEARLPHLFIISWFLPLGLLWFGWTALPPIPWAWSIAAGLPFGFGLVMLFLGITGYLTDCYAEYSTSALAANTLLRSLFGAVFAIFAQDMYVKLGTPWATSLLGFLAMTMAPLPWLFYKYGPRLRNVSKFHLATVSRRR